jgi:hypothetical protein
MSYISIGNTEPAIVTVPPQQALGDITDSPLLWLALGTVAYLWLKGGAEKKKRDARSRADKEFYEKVDRQREVKREYMAAHGRLPKGW